MEKDYKKLYLEQKQQSLILEMSLMQLRAHVVKEQLEVLEKQLKEYDSKTEDKS